MKIITIPFFISILILAVGMGFAYAHFANLDAQVILHFNAGTGPDYLGSSQEVFMIILSGMLLSFFNYLLAKAIRVREEFFATILSFASVLVASLILSAVFVIIANN